MSSTKASLRLAEAIDGSGKLTPQGADKLISTIHELAKIGGGSLELSNGVDEEPEVALSLPLGAGRLTREWLPDDPPGRRRVDMLRDWLATEMADAAAETLKAGSPDLAVATSKTFRSLARLTAAAPSGAAPA